MSPAGVLFATFAVLMLLGSPITVALGVAAMAALYTVDQNLVTLVQIAFTSVNSFPIMALPAFMLVGALMEYAGMFRQRKRCMAARPTAIMMPGITPARNILVMDCCPDTA